MAIRPPRKKEEAAGRYSGTDQQSVPEYGHGNHKQGQAAAEAPDQEGKPWQGPPHRREGEYGYRRDEGAHGREVDGDIPRKPRRGHKA
ncbi:hypothetical protein SAMN02745126_02498 [Enhydrobacter aerosaccus]|uniref:Uncharacterized protein n=1 Tax=Enhydrobacter aerosaccus TaxID=225324 RepID=A0A1T4NWT2_9HYPH|nr:hypothetical protein [Enhydrobacter aerosaccus]SJZ83665.1 hypothetical protein SAMN02745126_02498 [Enhydrobacter aerosaccus]